MQKSINEYYPDRWVILDMGSHKRIFASWYGGYTSGDTWKLSSGIENIIEDGDDYVLPQSSGSVYRIHKDMEGTTAWSSGILKQIMDVNPQAKCTTIEDVLNDYRDPL